VPTAVFQILDRYPGTRPASPYGSQGMAREPSLVTTCDWRAATLTLNVCSTPLLEIGTNVDLELTLFGRRQDGGWSVGHAVVTFSRAASRAAAASAKRF
jgi:hypothetical protein